MKKALKLSLALACMLATLAACDLFNGINLAWNIESIAWSSPYARVTYSVRNLGKYDLQGVNLQIGIDVNGDGTYPRSAWTPDFSIGQNQVLYGSIDVFTGIPPLGGASVISVDMDKPKG